MHEQEEDDSKAESPIEETQEVKILEVADNMEMALRSILGFLAKGMMKLKGMLTSKEVLVMVDYSATHNFIHQRIVDELELPLSETSHYEVVVENGVALKGKGICKAVVVVLPNLMIKEDFLPLELGQVDVILGMVWLVTWDIWK